MPKEVFLKQIDRQNYAFLKDKKPGVMQLLPVVVDPLHLPFTGTVENVPKSGPVFVHAPSAGELGVERKGLKTELTRVNGVHKDKARIPIVGKFVEARRIKREGEESTEKWQIDFALNSLKYKQIKGGLKGLNAYLHDLSNKDARWVAIDSLSGIGIEAGILATNVVLLALIGALTQDAYITVGSNVAFQGIARNFYMVPRARNEWKLLKEQAKKRNEAIKHGNAIKAIYGGMGVLNFIPFFGTFTFPFISFPRNTDISFKLLKIYKEKVKEFGKNRIRKIVQKKK